MLKNVELPGKKKKMIGALMTCRTIGEACEMAGVTRTTLSRWLADSNFRDALKQSQNDVLQESVRKLLAGHDRALDLLWEIIENADSDTVRRQAINDWFTQSNKFRESVLLEERISALEERLKK